MTTKKIVQYSAGVFYGYDDIVGKSVTLFTIDHPDFTEEDQRNYGLRTSRVTSYDEVTDIIETQNTVYVPAGPSDSSQA